MVCGYNPEKLRQSRRMKKCALLQTMVCALTRDADERGRLHVDSLNGFKSKCVSMKFYAVRKEQLGRFWSQNSLCK